MAICGIISASYARSRARNSRPARIASADEGFSSFRTVLCRRCTSCFANMDFNDRQSRITSGTDSGSNLLTSMTTYSDDYVLAYNYTNATDAALGRPTSISDSTGTLASFVYIGTGTQELNQTDNQAGISLVVTLNQFGQVYNQDWTIYVHRRPLAGTTPLG